MIETLELSLIFVQRNEKTKYSNESVALTSEMIRVYTIEVSLKVHVLNRKDKENYSRKTWDKNMPIESLI